MSVHLERETLGFSLLDLSGETRLKLVGINIRSEYDAAGQNANDESKRSNDLALSENRRSFQEKQSLLINYVNFSKKETSKFIIFSNRKFKDLSGLMDLQHAGINMLNCLEVADSLVRLLTERVKCEHAKSERWNYF